MSACQAVATASTPSRPAMAVVASAFDEREHDSSRIGGAPASSGGTLPAGKIDETLLFGVTARGTAPDGTALEARPREVQPSAAMFGDRLNFKRDRERACCDLGRSRADENGFRGRGNMALPTSTQGRLIVQMKTNAPSGLGRRSFAVSREAVPNSNHCIRVGTACDKGGLAVRSRHWPPLSLP